MKYLSPAEMRKYAWRPVVFLKKLKDREPFEVKGGKKVLLAYQRGVDKILLNGTREQLMALRFTTIPPSILIQLNDIVITADFAASYRLSDLVKTREFGGRNNVLQQERFALASLAQQIEDAKTRLGVATIPIRIGTKTFQVSQVRETPKLNGVSQKADFEFIDVEGHAIAWVSHKKGKRPDDFNQWGGMSEKYEPKIYNTREVQQFIKACAAAFPDGIPPASTAVRRIKSKQIRMMSVYGSEYGGPKGPQNVNVVLQGDIKLTRAGSAYRLDAFHVHLNGEEVTGAFEPVFQLAYKNDRSNLGVKHARAAIAPYKGRRITHEV